MINKRKYTRRTKFNPNSLKNLKPAWNKGKKGLMSEKQKERIKESCSGKKNNNWKGDKVGYRALHNWINLHKPKPLFCETCGKKRKLTASNISGEYKRDINDFKWECYSCNKKRDNARSKN